MPFTLTREPHEIVRRTVTLAGREWLTPTYVRLRLEGAELRGFVSTGSSDHIKLFFSDGGAQVGRDYTPLTWDAEIGTLDLEFLVHGDEGIAGRWARDAPIGSSVSLGGPRGSLVLAGRPDHWLLAVDETGIPAARRYIRAMDADAHGTVLVEVESALHELALDAPDGVEVRFVHRASGASLVRSLERLTVDDRPGDDTLFFAAAEQSIVKAARALAFERWMLDEGNVSIKGYWKRDVADHTGH